MVKMSVADWRRAVNPGGKYMPGKPAWYMFDNCQSKHAATIGVMCSAAFWSQNNGLQLQNLTIEKHIGRQRRCWKPSGGGAAYRRRQSPD
ncbi:acyl-CoA thioester hydrolase YbgC [Salmonella enterica subsp. indica]|uniref:Acyl-CoA thioester hydrolase YbgC n=1 Tax=Salmonella enterica subsp. indica TaxID=59207 RepID=A0A379XU01_SALER|nr:acyl-CoA thioester hydrolase YbgC [Salmonella enterica subsp. indica]